MTYLASLESLNATSNSYDSHFLPLSNISETNRITVALAKILISALQVIRKTAYIQALFIAEPALLPVVHYLVTWARKAEVIKSDETDGIGPVKYFLLQRVLADFKE